MKTLHIRALMALGVAVLLMVVFLNLPSAIAPAPKSEFLLTTGEKLHSDDYQGKVVLVNFWATTCTTCVAEMPEIVKTYEKYKNQGYQTIAVAMQYDKPEWVLNFAQTRNLPFHVALDYTGENAQNWGSIRLTPTTFLVNKKGEIVKTYVGKPDFEKLHALIEELLAQSV